LTPAAALRAAFAAQGAPARVGVAVSGGGDSMALLVLAAEWARAEGVTLAAVSVDHGLRPEAAEEAAAVARDCAALRVAHETLRWADPGGAGNLQDAARRARQRLIARWAVGRDIAHVALGHTLDDQAETVLMRLARGSGVDGLSAMAPARSSHGVTWLRPLLGVRRAALRAELRARGVSWAEDPGNDDPRFERVKARRALAALAPLGIDAAGLAETAARLGSARDALAQGAEAAARRFLRVEAGDVLLARGRLLALPGETRARIVAHVLCRVASAEYRPRHAKLAALIERIASGRGGTLHGCRVTVADDTVRVTRELQALRGVTAPPGALWDGRWRVTGPDSGGLHIAALGSQGLAAVPDWRRTGLPRATLQASPAVWQGDALVAAPLAGAGQGWQALLEDGTRATISSLLSR